MEVLMLGIRAIASYPPDHLVSNIERAEAAGKAVHFIIDKVGFTSVLRKSEGQDTSDLCFSAVKVLLAQNPAINRDQIECLIVVTQNPDGFGLPDTSAIAQHKWGLSENVAAFDVSLGCSDFVYGLRIILAFLNAHGLRHGLLFTSDRYSKVIDPEDYNTEVLFGGAAAVTYIL
jgi:3-oxoacyl-[acyl-carrier-protein] synthase-3